MYVTLICTHAPSTCIVYGLEEINEAEHKFNCYNLLLANKHYVQAQR